MNILEQTEPLTAEVRAYARTYPKGFDIPLHRHAWGQLIYARAGVMTVTVASPAQPGSWVVPPQRALWVPAETDHWIRCGTRLSMRTLYIAPATRALPERCCVVNVPPLLRELILSSVEAPGPTRRRRLLTALILNEIRVATVAPLHLPEPSDPRLLRITGALRERPGDARTLGAWAREAGASTRTLSRLFVAQTGMTFRQWQRQARLLAALVLLAEDTPVTTVAFDLGYESPSAFISAFRRALGKTPRRYFDA
jgi:AraC-like DNA-binding protein/quercetin dioxygenase-like cupin family protein